MVIQVLHVPHLVTLLVFPLFIRFVKCLFGTLGGYIDVIRKRLEWFCLGFQLFRFHLIDLHFSLVRYFLAISTQLVSSFAVCLCAIKRDFEL